MIIAVLSDCGGRKAADLDLMKITQFRAATSDQGHAVTLVTTSSCRANVRALSSPS